MCLYFTFIIYNSGGKDALILIKHSHICLISDNEAPELGCPNMVYETDMGLATAINVTLNISVWDNEDSMPVLECSLPTDYTFQHGDTLVSCNATDRSGNEAYCTFYVTVIGRLTILLQ